MAGFWAQVPNGDAPDTKRNAHCVTDYCYVFPAVTQPTTATGIWRVFGSTIWTKGTAGAQWLRRCATNRKVAGSIPPRVIGFFIDIKSLRSHYGPGVDSASKWVPGAFPGGKGGRCVRLTTYHHPVPFPRNLGTVISWNPLGHSTPVRGLLYLYNSKSI